jgi:hypothetical protein
MREYLDLKEVHENYSIRVQKRRDDFVIREIPKSSGPFIGRDTWRAVNVSLTRTLEKSKGRLLINREPQNFY